MIRKRLAGADAAREKLDRMDIIVIDTKNGPIGRKTIGMFWECELLDGFWDDFDG